MPIATMAARYIIHLEISMPDIVIMFFLLGVLAGLAKSDLKVPKAAYDTLSILLMLTLGLKGGLALHGQVSWHLLRYRYCSTRSCANSSCSTQPTAPASPLTMVQRVRGPLRWHWRLRKPTT
jgi:hypothetical protein